MGAASSSGFAREELQPLTQFRQQHRRTVDGRLRAAAFVQNRETYTGCTDAPSPKGDSGRPWCYVEAQLVSGGGGSWNYCAPIADYAALRKQGAATLGVKVGDVRAFVSKLGKRRRLGKSHWTCIRSNALCRLGRK